ncbi:MAG TPA: iron-containing redox enzyme family protein [Microlunatus sp.]|nr:iron-containing redox enzyme family protein [Microlunatus sp.]
MSETSTPTRRLLGPDVTLARPISAASGDHRAAAMERVHRGDVPVCATGASTRRTSSFDQPVPLPPPRGPVSAALVRVLSGDPRGGVDLRVLRWTGDSAEATTDEDLQLALWLAYEQHYRGLADVDDRWEWHPELVWARRGWEERLLDGLREHASAGIAKGGERSLPDRVAVQQVLDELASADDGPSLSKFLMRDATSRQFAEFLIHRSLYHLKEADPHSWGIPRLSGSVKAAMVTIQADEYGGGATPAMHAQLFRSLLSDWDLHAAYGHYLDQVPGVTLMATNLISLFGLHRRWRGALVGHLAMFEMTSSVPNARYARAHRRLGGGEEAALFFDEHVVVDSVHDQIALHDLAGGLISHEPHLAEDIIFGARCAAYADAAFARHVLDRWEAGVSSLLCPARLGQEAS